MKKVLLLLIVVVLTRSSVVAARYSSISDTTSLYVDSRYASDSLAANRQSDINPAASISLISAVLSAFAMISTLLFLSFVLFGLAGALSITALIAGVVGFRKRKKLLTSTYLSDRNSNKRPLGQRRLTIGIVIGSIVTLFALLLAISLAAY